MVAELPVMLVMDGPEVILTAFSLASSMGFCANNGAADNISDKPKSVSVRFILFVSYTEGKYLLEFACVTKRLCSCITRTCRKRHECARFSDLPSSKGVTRRGLHLQSWISRAAGKAALGFWLLALGS